MLQENFLSSREPTHKSIKKKKKKKKKKTKKNYVYEY